jgi:hypothetical protein
LFEGINNADSYRVEVYVSYEFVPTMVFESWTDVKTSKTPREATSLLKKFIESNLFNTVSGVLGEQLSGTKFAKGLVVPAFNTLMNFI